MATTWSSDHSTIYRGIHLWLAITNDLSLAIGSNKGGLESKHNATTSSIQLVQLNVQARITIKI
jgi:hypothetical protein